MNRKAIIAVSFLALFLAIPLVNVAAATASVTPGSTTTTFGIPVTQSFTGLLASTEYTLTEYSGTNGTGVTFNSDSDGKATLTITPDHYGQNDYEVRRGAFGYEDLGVLFTIENMDIMPYIVILITISILFSVLKMFTGGKGGMI